MECYVNYGMLREKKKIRRSTRNAIKYQFFIEIFAYKIYDLKKKKNLSIIFSLFLYNTYFLSKKAFHSKKIIKPLKNSVHSDFTQP